MAKKIIRLTESDLHKIVKRVIQEQSLPIQGKQTMQAFIKVENGKKFVYFESEMNPGEKTKYGPVIANHLQDGERFQAYIQDGKLYGKKQEIKKIQ